MNINDLLKENEERVQLLSTDAESALEEIKNLKESAARLKIRLMAVMETNQETALGLQQTIAEAGETLDSYFQATFENINFFQERIDRADLEAEEVTNHWQEQLLTVGQTYQNLDRNFQQQIGSLKERVSSFHQRTRSVLDRLQVYRGDSLASLEGFYELGETIRERLNESREKQENTGQSFLDALDSSTRDCLENFQPFLEETTEETERLIEDLDDCQENLENVIERADRRIEREISETIASLEQSASALQEKADHEFGRIEESLSRGEEKARSMQDDIVEIARDLANCRDDLGPLLGR